MTCASMSRTSWASRRCADLDDTGDLKRGDRTVGVQRQYTGTAGKIENAQVAVFLGHSSGKGRVRPDSSRSCLALNPQPTTES